MMEIKSNAGRHIDSLYRTVKKSGYEVSKIEEKQYNYEFFAVKNNSKNKIQVFFGKKGIKTVIQGNSSSSEYIELKNISSDNYSFDFVNDEEKNYEEYIGTDETGKGDFFGPLVIAGFYTNKIAKDFLIKSGVRDSKELNDNHINVLAEKICAEFPNNYKVVTIFPEEYNELYMKVGNINEILRWGHSEVIKNLYESSKTNTVIIDQFSKKDLSIIYSDRFSNVEFIQIPKAEKYMGVAAASIIARRELNKWFYEMDLRNFKLPKGASHLVETAAKNLLRQVGKENLNKFVKLHFKTTKKILSNL
jgi:ribonuclease HIII